MAMKLKKGAKIYVTEGPQQGATGIVSMIRREFDPDMGKMRWTVWVEDSNGGDRIKTRLAWVREI